jgi:ABC-type multidrug transport system fused ATPase/permease subunit
MALFHKLSKIYPEASLGTQRRTMMSNNVKTAAKVIAVGAGAKLGADMMDAAKEVVLPKIQEGVEAIITKIKSTDNNDSTISDASEKITSGTNVVDNGESIKTTSAAIKSEIVGTSPNVSEWDPFRVVNPEWFARSPFALEDTTDILVTGLILFVITLIILFYVMWSSYYSNAVTSFLIGKKKLPVYHLGLISIAVLMSVFTLSLVYLAAFTGMIVETASMNKVSYEIARLEREIQEVRTLLELNSSQGK